MLATLLLALLAPSGGGWELETALLTSPLGAGTAFGYQAAIDGDTIVVRENSSTTGYVVHVFVRSGGGWNPQAVLSPSLPGPLTAVDVSGDVAVATSKAAASVFVFERVGTAWTETARLVASAPTFQDDYGANVTVDGDTIAVGAPDADVNGYTTEPGAVYVYTRGGGTWPEQARVLPTIPFSYAGFGSALDLEGDRLAVGAPFDTLNGLDGCAYVFERTGTTWTQKARVHSPHPGQLDTFGGDVALSGDALVVGESNDSSYGLQGAGAAHVFAPAPVFGWNHVRELLPPEPESIAWFGSRVAVQGSTALVAAPGKDAEGNADAGAVYVYLNDGGEWVDGGTLGVSNPTTVQSLGQDLQLDGCASVTAAEGEVFVHRIAPVFEYCEAGLSGLGCSARISSSGVPSASASSGFLLEVTQVEGARAGLFYFGANGRQQAPWGASSSYQCVVPPVRRGALLAPAGTAGVCDGAQAYDLNARWTQKPGQNPGAGAVVQAQYWYRDPLAAGPPQTATSNALEFTVCP